MAQHRDLVTSVAERIGVSVDEARRAAEATIATLVRTVAEPQRQQVIDAVPALLTENVPAAPGPAWDEGDFVAEVSWLTGMVPEEARARAQAVLFVLSRQEPELVGALELPGDIRDLITDPGPGGGVTGPRGQTAPLTDNELAAALVNLPYWVGNHRAIHRTIELPEANLRRVLDRLERLREEYGRAPDIDRDGDSATLTVSTSAVDAVTHLDVDLAHRVDDAIVEAGAGMASS
ncbi:4a-hydroxytetrahydrobiopterin dehydratase [Phytohabitans kaempferiae]|uniref:Putative pterin-4-alpha-carbinolamine dehydratase n=1 Tax=Phytohabitans kaempferiae TaxID=1620943 RepID=A0ABV6M9U7_9ACTN